MPVVMGSAGHIDHGKTSLVRALTGTDCDRLEEEKRRGITIELGFAYLPLPAGRGGKNGDKLSIVDVPGHERFVKNMVAGAAGIDFVTLVIAADEGVMPQTREHLEICGLLGIRKGLVALTKIDLVDDDWLALVTEDVKSFLKGTFLEDAQIFPVSSVSGEGLDALKGALYDLVEHFNPRRRSDLPRLPVDRVFTMRGHGTVVTGTLISGSFKLGEDVELMPCGLASKVRGLQSHGSTVELAPAGYRTAVNLPGLEVEEISKGDVLTRPGSLRPAHSWLVSLECLPSSPRALRNRTEVHFHHSAREVQARISFFDRDKLEPGQSALCRVRFTKPMVGVFGDRCVLRSFSPVRTVAGGSVIEALDFELRKKDPAYARKLEILGDLSAKNASGLLLPEESVLAQLELGGRAGVDFTALCILTNLDSSVLEKTLHLLGSRQQVFMVDKEERRYIGAEAAESLSASCLEWLAAFHKREPMRAGPGRSELLSSWGKGLSPKFGHFVLERLLKQGALLPEGEAIRLPAHKASVAGGAAGIRDALLKAYVDGGLTPPNLKEVLAKAAISPREAAPVVKMLMNDGELVKLTEDIYYAGPVLTDIKDKAVNWFDTHDNLDIAGLKEVTGLSRKYLVAILEYFDKTRLTVRVGDKRILRK